MYPVNQINNQTTPKVPQLPNQKQTVTIQINPQAQEKVKQTIAQVGAQVGNQNQQILQTNQQKLKQLQQLVQQKNTQAPNKQAQPLRQTTGGSVSAKSNPWQVAVGNWITGVQQKKFDVLPYHNIAFSTLPLLEKQKGTDLWELNRLLNEGIINQNTFNERKQDIEKDYRKRIDDKLLHQIPIYKLLNEHFSNMTYRKATYNNDICLQIPCKLNVNQGNKSELEQYGMLEITFLKDHRVSHAFLKPIFSEQNAKLKYGVESGPGIWEKLNDIYYNTGKVGQVQDTHEGLDFIVTYLVRVDSLK